MPKSMAARSAIAGMVMLVGELAYAARRPLPTFTGYDASGIFGDPSLPELRLIAIGDSTMTGPGLDGPDAIYIRVIARALSDRYHVRLTSLAVGGARSFDALRSQVPRAINHQPHLTLISVGANDVFRAVPVPRFERNLEAIVAAMKTVSGAVVLMGVGDIGTSPRCLPPLDRLATLTGKIADRVHTRVAVRQGVLKADHWGLAAAEFRDPAMFSPDLFHPSAAGHQVWAETLLPEIEEALAHIQV